MQDINGLFVALEAAYPTERRKTPAEFLDYEAGKRFVQTLLAAAHRAIDINDASVFSGGLRFQGESLLALIQHMYQNGLEFAPPEPGGEGVYKTLFQNLRALYISMGARTTARRDAQERAAPRADKAATKAPESKDNPKGDQRRLTLGDCSYGGGNTHPLGRQAERADHARRPGIPGRLRSRLRGLLRSPARRRDSPAGRRSFVSRTDGWYVRCAGGEMSINGRRVVGATHVRSGDVIRMSESGPEFSFRIVAGARGITGRNHPPPKARRLHRTWCFSGLTTVSSRPRRSSRVLQPSSLCLWEKDQVR